jgi:hypothetical protein
MPCEIHQLVRNDEVHDGVAAFKTERTCMGIEVDVVVIGDVRLSGIGHVHSV